MKKLILSFLSCLILFSAYATDYTGDLKITALGQETTDANRIITVEQTDAANMLYRLSITDFKYSGMKIGDVVVDGVNGEKQTDGSVKLKRSGYTLSVKLLVTVKVTVNFEGVISSDGMTFTITKLDIEVPNFGTVTCTFEGTAPASTAIQSIVADTNDYQIYNLTGRRVDNMNESGIYIIRYSNGVTKKIIKK